MEVGAPFEEVGGGIEGATAFGNDGVELFDGLEILVGDGLVEHLPEAFGRLQLQAVARQIDEAEAVGHRQARLAVPAGAVDHQDDETLASGAGFTAKSASSFSKNGLETQLERYQKASPPLSETKAVT